MTAMNPHIDRTGHRERQLAWLTVGVPAVGTLVALVLAWQQGIGWLEFGALASMYLLTALGVGLLIGVVRERRHQPGRTKAGTRTHALVAMLGYVSWSLGTCPFVVTVLVIGALVIGGYQATAQSDPGQTGEVALLATLMLSALAQHNPSLSAALGVLAAALLHAKQASQRISRVLITDQELQDALILAAAALVVMPLLSDQAMDPWGVLQATTLWRIVVLVMAVGMLGHVAQRALGGR